MTRFEATAVAGIGVALTVTGATLLWGPWALVAAGIVLVAVALFVIDVK